MPVRETTTLEDLVDANDALYAAGVISTESHAYVDATIRARMDEQDDDDDSDDPLSVLNQQAETDSRSLDRMVSYHGHTWLDRGERDDPESVLYDGRYTGPSEIELGGGCSRCGVPDDCYCNG